MDNNGTLNLLTGMTDCEEMMIATLSPSLFDFVDQLPVDSGCDDGQMLDADDILPDLSSLEDFVDLTGFIVSTQRLVSSLALCLLPLKLKE